jgi:hypothetical protein
MSRARLLVPLSMVMLTLVTAPSHATTVVVPDQYATIQAAIDQSPADTILVKDGDYPEVLEVARSVTLRAWTSASFYALRAMPQIRGLHISYASVTCSGLQFRGSVWQTGSPSWLKFEACRLDSGYASTVSSAGITKLYGCLVFGAASFSGSSVEILGCSFIGGGVTATSEGDFRVRGNYITGPAAIGLAIYAREASGSISDNIVTGATEGIFYRPGGGPEPVFSGNEVRDCASNGYRMASVGGGGGAPYVAFVQNHARRCGGNGFDMGGRYGTLAMQGNTADSVGGAGILVRTPGFFPAILTMTGNEVRLAQGNGIDVGTNVWQGSLTGNRVLACGGSGIRVQSGLQVTGNVAGRCGGHGLVAETGSGFVLSSNTTYHNAGSGIAVQFASADSLHHNIAYLDERYGLEVLGGTAPVLGCNDWNGNWLGATFGTAPAATDLAVSPLFCDWVNDDVTLSSVSALVAPANGCGRIGALGVGCDYPATANVAGGPPRSGFALSVSPQPAGGRVRFGWAPQAAPVRLEVFDAHGARRWSRTCPAGTTSLLWQGDDDDGRALPAGVYFVRAGGDGQPQRARVVLVR